MSLTLILIRNKYNGWWLAGKKKCTKKAIKAKTFLELSKAQRYAEKSLVTNIVVYEEYALKLRKKYEAKDLCE